jgi:uroporphyrin-III C-methyltransferase / precorrin-2 dehydrogenase / sirohydrochlorin ferrochelatase
VTSPGRGCVSLVGAGPGDPELLTIRAVRRLQDADLVLYDALVSTPILKLAPRARCFCVGKRAGRAGVPQTAINRLMCRSAKRGERVVRLKCGDPFVLGRGGEEALTLASEGIAVEIVPGISAAIAAPALAGIPVTHRGVTTGFVVISGHAEDAYRAVVDSLAPGALTLVVLMGLAARGAIAGALLDRGWRGRTPAAVLRGASRPDATTWIGTLRDLATMPVDDSDSAPGTIVIGDVVDIGASLGWRANDARSTVDVGRSMGGHAHDAR